MKGNLNNIPTEMKAIPQWVCWKGEPKKKGKLSKLPINPTTGRFAKTNDPTTWATFDEAVECYEKKGFEGIGFVFSDSDQYIGVDLDNCYDPETQAFNQVASDAIKRFGSYTEFSPSGNGIHIIIKGQLNGHGKKTSDIEIYDKARFFTFTGNTVEGCSGEISHAQKTVTEFLENNADGGENIDQNFSNDSEDDSLIRKAMNTRNGEKFRALWDGDFSGYPSQSEADLALCEMLSYWTGGDMDAVDRLFRKSGLYRPKWEQSAYRQATFSKIIDTQSVYRETNVKPAVNAETRLPKFNLTDLGNSERLVYHHGKDIRYCHKWKRWLIWDGQRWAEDKSDHIKRLAKQVVRSIYDEAKHTMDSAESRDIAKHAMRSESSRHISAMISLAESEFSIDPDELDQVPWLLNCQNGTIDLGTGKLREHRRNDYITKVVPVNYNPDAPHPLWDSFLERILDNDQELISFMQRAIGYSLTGLTDEQCLFILYGHGANGKSTFLQAISHVLDAYAMQTPTETLLIKGKGAIPNDVARLKGARFVTASEAEAEQRLAENLIKQMTGGDTLSARFLHQEYFDFKPTHKLFLGTNHKPVIKGTDHAIWRRIRLIPFEVTIPEEERDPKLLEKLLDEAEGILAWAVVGYQQWRIDGLGMPPAVKKATDCYRSEMDKIAQFIEECCEIGSNFSVTNKDLYHAFSEWCSQNGEQPVTQTFLTRRLKELGYESLPKVGPQRRRGIKGLRPILVGLE